MCEIVKYVYWPINYAPVNRTLDFEHIEFVSLNHC